MRTTTLPPESADTNLYIRTRQGEIKIAYEDPRNGDWRVNLEAAIRKGVDLSGLCLNPATQDKKHFIYALNGLDLSNGILNRADLSGFNLDDTIFDGCELNDANLERVTGIASSFKKVIARNIRMAYCQFGEPNLTEADFTGSNWFRAALTAPVFDDKNYNRTNFTKSRMVGIRIKARNRLRMDIPESIAADMMIYGLPSSEGIKCNFDRAILHGCLLHNINPGDKNQILDISPVDAENSIFTTEEKEYLRTLKQWPLRDEYPNSLPIVQNAQALENCRQVLAYISTTCRNYSVVCDGPLLLVKNNQIDAGEPSKFFPADQIKKISMHPDIAASETVMKWDVPNMTSLPALNVPQLQKIPTPEDTQKALDTVSGLPNHLAVLFGAEVQDSYARLTREITDIVVHDATALNDNVEKIEAIRKAFELKPQQKPETPRHNTLMATLKARTLAALWRTSDEKENDASPLEILRQKIEALHTGIDADLKKATTQADQLYTAKSRLDACLQALQESIDGLEAMLPEMEEKEPAKADLLRNRQSNLRLTFIAAGMGRQSLDLFYKERVDSQQAQLALKGVTAPFLGFLMAALASREAGKNRRAIESLNESAQRLLLQAADGARGQTGSQLPGVLESAQQRLEAIDQHLSDARNQWLDSLTGTEKPQTTSAKITKPEPVPHYFMV